MKILSGRKTCCHRWNRAKEVLPHPTQTKGLGFVEFSNPRPLTSGATRFS